MSKDDRFQAYLDSVENAATWHKRTPTEQAEFDRAAAGAFPGGPNLKPRDCVLHPDAGRCQVLKIEGSVVHLVAENGDRWKVCLNTTSFAPHAIEEGGQRLFSLAPKEPH